jgi:hypothetical protein
MSGEDADLGMLIQRCELPKVAGMDAMEARLVVVQEVPPKGELRFYALRGEYRELLTHDAALSILRAHVPQKPVDELSTAELMIEVSALRAEVDRVRPVYEAAKAWRARILQRPIAAAEGVVVGIADALVDAVDAAVAKENVR